MNSKPLLITLLLASSFIAGAAHAAAQSDTSKVKTTVEFCEAGETQSSKFIASADTFVLSCDCDCTAQENRIWIIPNRSRQTYQLDASKAVSTLELKGIAAIPDTFGPVPLCEKPQEGGNGITILTKMPSTGGASPYCYAAEPFIEKSIAPCESAQCKKVLASLGRL
ncbi:hypothetical protein D3C76_694170 [compost metagenome]|uniref:Uncharacterized protein n=1 Tax=Pseudomonas jinjuensis TaxID=198616 RepID=A0A1H0BW54_9PSED|nr:hypothetical protein [Pseudomonas jinjuensis]SDN49892.1 hypothetical protein SAMN05216193_103218 [Pseudomonas jinjuensis]